MKFPKFGFMSSPFFIKITLRDDKSEILDACRVLFLFNRHKNEKNRKFLMHVECPKIFKAIKAKKAKPENVVKNPILIQLSGHLPVPRKKCRKSALDTRQKITL